MQKIGISLLSTACLLSAGCSNTPKEKTKPPNIIFILSDDLCWGDLGCYGQQKIKTPNIVRIAAEGILFTRAYCGNAVSAPSRCCLMTGLHPGHARIRDNSYQSYRESLQPGDFTVAHMLKQAGYTTGLFGKWGLANHDQPGIPNNMGFDEFFGYLNQAHAHAYYPEFLYHNQERIFFPGNADHFKRENYSSPSPYDENGKCLPNGIKDPSEAKYSFDVYCEKSLEFIKANKDDPFFLYLAYTIPHGQLIVPDLGIYKDENWDIQHKEWAAMITRMDTGVGKLMSLLKELEIDENTIIFFTSDNGNTGSHDKRYLEIKSGLTLEEFFNHSSPTRGGKGNSYDGAFHVPAMVRWPGHIKPGQVSDQVWAFWDFLPTAADIAGIEPPPGLDGISILPVLIGKTVEIPREYLYWEYKQNQAVRSGKWYAHKTSSKPVELYDLISDPGQSLDLSRDYPDIVRKMEEIMQKSHTPSDVWPSPGESQEQFSKRLRENKYPYVMTIFRFIKGTTLSHLMFYCCLTGAADMTVCREEMKDVPRRMKDTEWEILFDGKSMDKWRAKSDTAFPLNGWKIENGLLFLDGRGGDIITRKKYSDFELLFDFNLTEGANSGVKYFVDTITNRETGNIMVNGPEYQIIDDYNHPEIKKDPDGLSSTASAYLLYAPKNKKLNPYGEWNTGKIVARGIKVEHWLNGVRVLTYKRGSKDYLKRKADTKFRNDIEYGELKSGHIMLTDHNDKVYFRNIKIREF